MSLQAAVESPVTKVPRRSGPWKFWGTILWCLAIVAAFLLVGVAGIFAMLIWLNAPAELTDAKMTEILSSHVPYVTATFGASLIAALTTLALAVHLSRLSARTYLGLVIPEAYYVKFGFTGLALLYGAFTLIDYFLWPQSGKLILRAYQEALSSGALLELILTVVVVAPIIEELIMRGFVQRGWAASRLGPTLAILLTTFVWTIMHQQYDWPLLVNIFCIGLLFGWLRNRSGSTLLTILLHITQNAAVLIHTALYVWLGVRVTA